MTDNSMMEKMDLRKHKVKMVRTWTITGDMGSEKLGVGWGGWTQKKG